MGKPKPSAEAVEPEFPVADLPYGLVAAPAGCGPGDHATFFRVRNTVGVGPTLEATILSGSLIDLLGDRFAFNFDRAFGSGGNGGQNAMLS